MLATVILILEVLSHVADAQSVSGVTANGQTFLCLPTGTYCPTVSNTVDPRIVTPTGTTVTNCPTGYFACYGQTTQCGRIFVNATTSTNGNSDFGAYPWQAYLNNATNSFSGSGVLLDSFHVLTAAHKVYLNENNPTAVTVSMGVWNPYNRVNVQSSTVRTITLHPNFKKTAPLDYKNDIAVLTLTQPIVLGIYSNINTACLPAAGASYTGQSRSVQDIQSLYSLASQTGDPYRLVVNMDCILKRKQSSQSFILEYRGGISHRNRIL
ncbi:hypothetical protein JTB14_009518 [Gonioctena quinquepunctata]|nr:hypothetical protein JTB14_009518 [Gonioctena quinquepunctata]